MDTTLGRRAWLPLPVLLAATAMLWLFPVAGVFEFQLLRDSVYVVAILPASCYIAFVVARSYRLTGHAGLLLLGCGTLSLGLCGSANGILAEHSANAMLTGHNSFIWLSGVCHVCGVFLIRRPERPATGSMLAIGAAYGAVLAIFIALVAAALADLTPPFFIPGRGATPLREAVLLSALLMFLATGSHLLARPHRGDAFTSWYGIALLLIAIGLLGITLQSVPGTAMVWLARIAQWMGTAYMVVAAITVTRRHAAAPGVIMLTEIEQRWAELADLAGDGIVLHEWSTDSNPGYFVHANPAICAMLGYSAKEMSWLSLAAITAPEEGIPEDKAAVTSDGESTCRKTLLTRDGRRVPTEFRMRRFRYRERDMVVSVIRDIGERLADEHQRAELAAIVESSQDAIIGKNLDGTITSWNAGAKAIFGYSADEMIGRNISLLFPPDRIREESRLLAKLAQGRRIGTFESVRVRKDGTQVDVSITVSPLFNSAGQVIAAADIARDISVTKQSEQARRESEQRLRMALDAAFLISFEWDIVNDRVYRYASSESAVPARPGAATLEEVRQTVHPEDRQCFTANIRAAIDAPDGRYESEFRVIHADGTIAWFSDRGRIERDELGRPLRLVGLSQDVTQRKELIIALEAAKDAADEANRAKSAFLANMSHEIRTPLNVILGMIHLVKKEGLSAPQAQRLGHVVGAADHLLAVINDILDLSKIEAGKLELEDCEMSIDAILRDVMSLQAPKASAKGLQLVMDAQPLPYIVHGDAMRLTQALLNLASNAVKFTERGTVTIGVAVQETTDDQVVLRFDVVDTGIGIAPEDMARLFSPFEQADRSTTRKFGGTGLGLAITRRLVEFMGGEAGAISMPGQGSDFWFTVRLGKGKDLPASQADHNRFAESAAASSHNGYRVLLAEDDVDDRLVMTELLNAMELRVDAVADGTEAVNLAGKANYDLVLLDIRMPRMDGIEAARRIRALPGCDALPIVAVTINAFGGELARYLEAGMNASISKPLAPEEFCATVLKWLATAETASA